ncbi:bifunctional transcriptional activator/DNA repair enzyme AdaA [Chitinophaga rhizosphaerae]|uniref:bifunctional transcriptional activator/DNA repair enzyme AdaA n=1 Tax=Chitinophaga rhizosphaerae TaxID=1864947 RepID=UPI000F7FFB5F|nr:methylated-DNA--[protein]-cysteine S-methyltransferase [Chitinophaga rhizosphaerae]
METQQQIDFNRIASAIAFLRQHFKDQPDLEAAAGHVHLSPFHFQRMFQDWAGVSPKQFLQYLSLGHAKGRLVQGDTLSDAAFETGLSGTSRLHDLFVKIEGMTPGEFRNGGAGLQINYSFAESPFGSLIVASTEKGVCHMAFADAGEAEALRDLQEKFPQAAYRQFVDVNQQNALFIFGQDWKKLPEIKLHLKGSPFQIRVWETLLNVPMGGLVTYSGLAEQAGHTGASRAVGTAVAANPVAFLIPCHRVIRASGDVGQYHWGSNRKSAMIGWEAAKVS